MSKTNNTCIICNKSPIFFRGRKICKRCYSRLYRQGNIDSLAPTISFINPPCIVCNKTPAKIKKMCRKCYDYKRHVSWKYIGTKHNTLCSYGCGEKAKYYSHSKNKYCCASHLYRCPSQKAKLIKRGNTYVCTKEVKQELSRKAKEKWKDPEYRKKVSKAMGLAKKKCFADPEFRKKHSARMKSMCGAKNANWKGGISTEPYCHIFKDKEWREIIYIRDAAKFCWNPQCSERGSRQALHHINYNKMDCDLRNIITVCISCNSKANGDREWWQSYYQILMSKLYGYKY